MAAITSLQSVTAGFIPTSIPGCALWLDAADANTFTYSSGSNIATWRDKSSNAALTNNVDAGSTYTTDLGLPAVFMPQARMTISNFTMNREHSMFLVTRGSNTTNQFLVANWTSNYLMHFYYGNDAMFYDRTVAFNDGSPPIQSDNTQRGVISYTYNRTTFRYRKNGTLTSTIVSFGATPTPAGTDTGNFFINGNGVGSFRTNVHVSEIIIFNVALTDAEHQTVEGYLATKWGIRSRLPNSHIFKSLPPFTRPFVPVDISGCEAWFDGADTSAMTFSGSTIMRWLDKSGSNRYADSIGPQAPTLGLTPTGQRALVFGGSSYLSMNNADTLAPNSATYFLQASGLTPNDRTLLALWQNSRIMGPTYYWNTGANLGLSPYTWLNTNAVLTVTENSASNCSVHFNGNLVGTIGYRARSFTEGYAASSVSRGYIGTHWSPGAGWVGTIQEIIMYNGALGSNQRQLVESYLVNKWRTRGSTPAGHYARLAPALSLVFIPTAIASCALWLDGADPAGNGTRPSAGTVIATWADKSGANNSMSSFGSPTFQTSPSRIAFNGSQYLQSLNITSAVYTAFFVYQKTSSIGPLFVTTTADIVTGLFPNQGGTLFLARSDTQWYTQTSSLPPDNQINILAVQYDGSSNIFVWLNGALIAQSTVTGTITRNRLALGYRFSAGSGITGSFYEVVQMNSALTVQQRQAVEGYLANKWGLINSLPNGHPFKTAKP